MRSSPLVALLVWTSCASALLAAPAGAHQFAPSLLEIVESEPGRAAVRWKQPQVRVMGSELRPVLPPDCETASEGRVAEEGTGFVLTWEVECAGSFVGKTVRVEGLAGSRANSLVRVGLADGRSFRHVLTPDDPKFVVPEAESRIAVVRGYTLLGFEHILAGWDHLLFVLALVLIVGWGRTLLWTITAFTAGHSVTLALAVLGVVNVPSAPIEAAIALSIYFLAVELSRKRPDTRTWVERGPWVVAGAFGLVHGLGFAGALSEVGLPQGEIPLALFAFNVGIELGQLAFVVAVLIVWQGLRWVPVHWPTWAGLVPAYGIGSVAVFWTLERLWGAIA